MEDKKLNRVKKFYYRTKRLPTYREMQKLLGYRSTSPVAYVVSKWMKEDIMRLEGSRLAPGDEFFALPLLGSIRAGEPTMEQHYDSETLSFNNFIFKNPGSVYLLKVSGDSMIGAGIHPGDWVVLDKSKDPKDGDIIAANVDWQWTLKYFRRKDGVVYLAAANPAYDPIFPRDNLEVGGVVIRVVREYY